MFTILSRPQLVRRLMSLAHAPLTQSGLIAAAVATLFRDPGVHHVLPCFCEEIIVHWPSLLAGILIGFLLFQVLEWLILLRAALSLQLRHQQFWSRNWQLARARLA